MFETDLDFDILDLSAELKLTDKGIETTFKCGMNSEIENILTEEEDKKISDSLDQISKTINKAIIRDFANDISKTFLDETKDKAKDDLFDLSFSEFMELINSNKELQDALDNVRNAFDAAKRK